MADIGSVSIRIVPNAQAFTTDLTSILTPGITRLSNQISRQLSSGIADSIARAIQEGLKAGGAGPGAGSSGRASGDKFADAFDRSVTTRITAALRALPDADIGVDSTEVDRKLAEIRTQLLGLSSKELRARVGINDASAIAAIEALKADLEELGKGDDIRVRVNSAAALAELAKLKAEINGVDEAANGKGPGSVGGAAGAPSLLFVGIAAGATLVGPAVGAATAALAGFGALAGTTALAVKGISSEMKAGTPIGNVFTSQIGRLKTTFQGFEEVAARGASTGLLDSLKDLNAFAPSLNPLIENLGTYVGRVFSISTRGLISGFEAMEPLLFQTGSLAEQAAEKFAEFTASPKFAQFVAYSAQELPKVAQDAFDVANAFGHVVVALQPLGDFLLTIIDDTAKAITGITTLLHYLTFGQTHISDGQQPASAVSSSATSSSAQTGRGGSFLGTLGRNLKSVNDLGGVFSGNRVVQPKALPTPLFGGQGTAGSTSARNDIYSGTAAQTQADKQAAALKRLAAAYGTTSAAYTAATASQAQQATALAATTLQMQLQNDASGLLSAALDKLDGKNLSAAQAQNAFEQSLVGLAQGIASTGTAVTGLTSGAIFNRSALLSAVQAAEQAAEAQGNAAGSTVVAKQKLADYTKQIEANAVAHGLDKGQVDKFIGSVLDVNALKVKPTKLDVETAEANSKIRALTTALQDAAAGKYNAYVDVITRLDAGTASANTAEHNAANQKKNDKLVKASGGYITGPGTGTSDSIDARLSNGEFVVNAKSTAANRALLEHLNRPGFADGGIVTITQTASQASSATRSANSASSSAVKKAATLASQQSNIRFTVSSDLGKFANATLGSVAQIQSAFSALINIVHSGLSKGVGSGALLAQLQSENTQLTAIASQRAATAAKLTKDQAKLATDLGNFNQEKSTVSQASTSGFDLPSIASNLNSGFSPFGGGTSATTAGIISALTKNNSAQSKFTAQITRLRKAGINPKLLQQIGEAGVSGGADAANALSGASASQIRKINSLFGRSNALGDQAGTIIGNGLFGSTINRDNAAVRGDLSRSDALAKQAGVVGKAVGEQVRAAISGLTVQITNLDGTINKEVRAEIIRDKAALKHLIEH